MTSEAIDKLSPCEKKCIQFEKTIQTLTLKLENRKAWIKHLEFIAKEYKKQEHINKKE